MNNVLGKLIYIDQYGSATVASQSATKAYWGKYSKNNKTDKYRKVKSNSVSSGQCTITYTTYRKWSNKTSEKNVSHGGKSHQQKYWQYNSAKKATGFLSTLASTYTGSINKWANTYFCASATEVGNVTGKGTFKTPSSVEFSFMDIDVEIDDETKKKTVADVGRGQTGKLSRNRVRDNVIKMEVEWNFLTPAELQTLLKALSMHGDTAKKSKAYQWIWVAFLNPYTNAVSTKKMYVGDRTVSAAPKGNYISLKVSLVEY